MFEDVVLFIGFICVFICVIWSVMVLGAHFVATWRKK